LSNRLRQLNSVIRRGGPYQKTLSSFQSADTAVRRERKGRTYKGVGGRGGDVELDAHGVAEGGLAWNNVNLVSGQSRRNNNNRSSRWEHHLFS